MSDLDYQVNINNIIENLHIENQSIPFNVLFYTMKHKLKETAHTRFIYHLLIYNTTILESFLKNFLSKYDFANEEWTILEPETSNIDITIEGLNNVIIIENKINNAIDQLSQIDRYVKKYCDSKKRKIFVLYLCRNTAHIPSERSFKEAKDKCHLLSYSYKQDISQWLRDLLKECRTNIRFAEIEQSLKQYVEYLDIIFDKQKLEMEDKIAADIKELIPVTDSKSYPAKIDKLIEKLKLMENVCWNLKYEYEWKTLQEKINEMLSERQLGNLHSMQELNWYYPEEMGIKFKISGIEKELWLVVSYMKQRYVGIVDINNNDTKNENLTGKLESILKFDYKTYSTPRYPLWFPVYSNESLVNEFFRAVDNLRTESGVNFFSSQNKTQK